MIRALRSLDVSVSEIPVPSTPEKILQFRRMARSEFRALLAIDAGGSPGFISCLKEIQEELRLPWLIWFLDDPEGYCFPKAFHEGYTLAFCWDGEIAGTTYSYSGWKGRPMHYLPLGTDPSVFFPCAPDRKISFPEGVFVGSTAHENTLFDEIAQTTPNFGGDVENVWRDYLPDMRQSLLDLGWTLLSEKTGRDPATLRKDPFALLWVRTLLHRVGIKKRRLYVSELIGQGGGVFGDERWRDLLEREIYRGTVPYGAPLRNIYQESAFVLDLRQPQSRTGLTQRIFDAGACGIPVLAEWSPEIDCLFEAPKDLFTFSHLGDARAVKERILDDPEGARRKAIQVQKDILSRHTYLHRAAEILNVLRRT